MSEATARVVLHEEVSRDEVERAAAAHGWLLANIVPATDERPFQLAYLGRDEADVLLYVDDAKLPARYLILRGDVERGAREVRASLHAYTPEELRALLEQPADTQARVRGLHYAALALGALDRDAVLGASRAALAHGDPKVRGAALWGAGFAGFCELREPVRKMASRDRDAVLRGRARTLAEGWG